MNARDRYDSLLLYYATEHRLPFSLVKAQMLAESNANPEAISSVGAKGLMQFMPATWDEIMGHGADPYNPELSIEGGCRYLRRLTDFFSGNTTAALAAYNWGMGNVRNHIQLHGRIVEEKLPKETREYVKRISAKREAIEAGGAST